MMLRELPFDAGPAEGRRARHAAALLLRAASRALDDLAARLALAAPAQAGEPVVEFHAEAGAPEGALYVNGQLVGHLLGVNRL
jgi:hypothetical protein